MVCCQASGCTNGSNDKRIHFFCFPNPLKDRERCKRWLENIGTGLTLDTFVYAYNKRICSDHFHLNCLKEDKVSKMLNIESKKLCLVEGAIPTIFKHKVFSIINMNGEEVSLSDRSCSLTRSLNSSSCQKTNASKNDLCNEHECDTQIPDLSVTSSTQNLQKCDTHIPDFKETNSRITSQCTTPLIYSSVTSSVTSSTPNIAELRNNVCTDSKFNSFEEHSPKLSPHTHIQEGSNSSKTPSEGKRWYLVKWKPKWVKKSQLPEGVFEKWEEKKAKRAKILAENPDAKIEPEEEETGFRILEERRIAPGEEIDLDKLNKELNGKADEEEEDPEGDEDEEDEDGEGEEDEEEEGEDEGMDEDYEEEEKYNINGVEIKEEPDDDGEYSGQNGLNISDDEELNTLSSIDRDIVLNALPGDLEVKEEAIKEEEEDEEEDSKISIPTDYSKPYS